jgi:hypothetical protein
MYEPYEEEPCKGCGGKSQHLPDCPEKQLEEAAFAIILRRAVGLRW